MPDGRYGVYADVFKKGRRVMTPGGKHRKELKKATKIKKMQMIIRNYDCERWRIMYYVFQGTHKRKVKNFAQLIILLICLQMRLYYLQMY